MEELGLEAKVNNGLNFLQTDIKNGAINLNDYQPQIAAKALARWQKQYKPASTGNSLIDAIRTDLDLDKGIKLNLETRPENIPLPVKARQIEQRVPIVQENMEVPQQYKTFDGMFPYNRTDFVKSNSVSVRAEGKMPAYPVPESVSTSQQMNNVLKSLGETEALTAQEKAAIKRIVEQGYDINRLSPKLRKKVSSYTSSQDFWEDFANELKTTQPQIKVNDANSEQLAKLSPPLKSPINGEELRIIADGGNHLVVENPIG